MCLILFAIDAHPDYDLIVAANRDEFYARPTEPAHIWSDPPWMIAGKDLEGGGTWLGLDVHGRLAMLTNFRDLKNIRQDAPSRGALVSDYFKANKSSSEYLESVDQISAQYNGFNLLCADPEGMFYYGNYEGQVRPVTAGIHGLSNALLNDDWPKVERGRSELAALIAGDVSIYGLMELLYNDSKAVDHKLPDTGVGLEMERMLSPMFIKSETYGSRTSSVILKSRKGQVTFLERTYDTSTYSYRDRLFEFRTEQARRLKR
ncbi:NRDE family protein [Fulvivirga sedimenti]|uniref:NRDE family protein n=1 Tax=Fulvivirga sedimenti TaxID=2879465 RepID=A0A9X1L0Q8_9BACT|nr:NRDE family protein [Fulvivirga sedimenti]MCA6078034.1 NRDE family protein [Fulvivirga sedimenti]